MSAACFAGISRKRTILDPGAWHLDLSLINKHLYAVSDEAKERGFAIPVIAAATASLVPQMRVDVMGLDRQRQANGEHNGSRGS
jgi:hypothetical protein